MGDAFEALANSCEELVFITDYSMRMLYSSSRFERVTGFTSADFQFPQVDNPFIHREDADDVATALTAFVADAGTVSDPIENRFLDRWGGTHRCRSTITKITYQSTTALLFACHVLDTSSPDDADVRQYRALIESSEDAIVRVDNGGRFLFANRRTHELLGHTAIDLGHLRFDDIIVPRDVVTFTTALANAVGVPSPVRFQLHVIAKDGRTLRVHTTLTSLGPFGHTGELLVVLRRLAD